MRLRRSNCWVSSKWSFFGNSLSITEFGNRTVWEEGHSGNPSPRQTWGLIMAAAVQPALPDGTSQKWYCFSMSMWQTRVGLGVFITCVFNLCHKGLGEFHEGQRNVPTGRNLVLATTQVLYLPPQTLELLWHNQTPFHLLLGAGQGFFCKSAHSVNVTDIFRKLFF